MNWLVAVYLLIMPEPMPAQRIEEVPAIPQDFAPPLPQTIPARLGRPRYIALPFTSLDDLLGYLADQHLTSGTVLEIKTGTWYRVETASQYRLVPIMPEKKPKSTRRR